MDLAPGAFLTRARTVMRGDVTTTEAYRQGRVRIQDEGSQLVAELAGRGERILDCCAAPGGKAAILAERNPESTVLACDVSARRLDQMKRLLLAREGRMGQISYEVVDAAELSGGGGEGRFEGAFDLVLCDVPCSGTGTLVRNPEIRHRINLESLPRHQQRQTKILRGAMRAVAAGGRLVYATCSLEPEENQAVVAACLAEMSGFRQVAFDIAPLVESRAIRPDAAATLRETAFDGGSLRTLPGVHPCDGFYAAQLVRH